MESREAFDTVNIHDVAREANVSIATVSRHLAGKKIRASIAVEQAIEHLDYRPNSSARGLRLGKHNTVATIVPDISNPYFARIVHELEATISNKGFRVVVASSNEDARQEVELLRNLSDSVDAYVLVPVIESSGTKETLERIGLPAVLVDRVLTEESAFDVVVVDNAGGAEQAAHHLLGLGHQEIGIISGPQTSLPGRIRHEHFIATVEATGILMPAKWRKIGQFTQEFGHNAILELMSCAERPTAIFVGNNLMAHGALTALNELGIGIPKEMSVLSFDDFELAELLAPPHTVISRPAALEGRAAGELLLNRLLKPGSSPIYKVLPVSLTLRASTATPPTSPIE